MHQLREKGKKTKARDLLYSLLTKYFIKRRTYSNFLNQMVTQKMFGFDIFFLHRLNLLKLKKIYP